MAKWSTAFKGFTSKKSLQSNPSHYLTLYQETVSGFSLKRFLFVLEQELFPMGTNSLKIYGIYASRPLDTQEFSPLSIKMERKERNL